MQQQSKSCPFYTKHGTCRFGDKCLFRHEEIFPHRKFENRNEERKPCQYYAKHGTCRFGGSCCFQHEGIVPKQTLIIDTKQPEKVCSFFEKHGTCRFGDRCRFQHEVVVPLQQPQACRHFNNGKCNLGSKCKFLHDETQVKARVQVVRPMRTVEFNEADASRCPHFFSILDEEGQPKGKCPHNNKCGRRHFSTDEERAKDKVEGWTILHETVFYAHYHQLADVLHCCENLNDLLTQRTRQPHTILWSEYDDVDRSLDYYKLTVPAGSTLMDVALTSTHDLDEDSRCKIAVVNYLLSSHHGNIKRKICIRMLKHPSRAKEFLDIIKEKDEYTFISSSLGAE